MNKKVIYKYKIKPNQKQVFETPWIGKILTAEAQHGDPCIWVEHSLDEEWKGLLSVRLIPTGIEYRFEHPNYNYINTIQLDKGELIFHVFAYVENTKISKVYG